MATKNAINSNIPIEISKGGTNATSMTTTDGVVYYDGTSLVTTAVGTATHVLTSNGAGSAPTFQAAAGGGGGVVVTQFTSNGTWTKDANAQWIELILIGGGSGGGSGRRGASGSAGGGAGGSTSVLKGVTMPASNFSASESVTVGSGGAGGAVQTANDTNGNNGTAGGASSVDVISTMTSVVQGASTRYVYGLGGTTTTSTAGAGAVISNIFPRANTPEVAQAGAGSNLDATSVNDFYGHGGVLGVAGGGAGANSGSEKTGGDAASLIGESGTLVAGGTGGVESGTINGTNGAAAAYGTIKFLTMGSGGGGGGGQSTGGSAGTGGDGGAPGGSGGGGGGSLNGTNSGAGGTGARGEVWIIEYLG